MKIKKINDDVEFRHKLEIPNYFRADDFPAFPKMPVFLIKIASKLVFYRIESVDLDL